MTEKLETKLVQNIWKN